MRCALCLAAAVLASPVVLAQEDQQTRGPSGVIFVTLFPERQGEPPVFAQVDAKQGTYKSLFKAFLINPRVSPDVRHVAYTEGDSLYIRDIAGKKEPKVLAEGRGFCCWSPDGKEILFSKVMRDANGVSCETLRIPVDGGGRRPVSLGGNELAQDWSADGKWLAITAAKRPTNSYFIAKVDGTGKTPLALDATLGQIRFGAEGRKVLAIQVRNPGTDMAENDLVIIDPKTSERRVVLQGKPKEFPLTACCSPDGTWIAYACSDAESRERGSFLEVIQADGTGRHRMELLPRVFTVVDWR